MRTSASILLIISLFFTTAFAIDDTNSPENPEVDQLLNQELENVIADSLDTALQDSLKQVKRAANKKQIWDKFITFSSYGNRNPANLHRFSTNTSWSLSPGQAGMFNNAVDGQWYIDNWTEDKVLTEQEKTDRANPFKDTDLEIKAMLELPSIFGFRLGSYGFDWGMFSYSRADAPGNMINEVARFVDTPLGTQYLDQTLKFQTISYSQISISKGWQSKYFDSRLRLGYRINFMGGIAHAQFETDNFTVRNLADSIVVRGSGIAEYSDFESEQGSLSPSHWGLGFDFGLGLDLSEQLNRPSDLQIVLCNVGPQIKLDNITKVYYSIDALHDGYINQDDDDDTILDSLATTADDTLVVSGTSKVKIPAFANISFVTQPFNKWIFEANWQQSFSDEFNFSTRPNISFDVNYFPWTKLRLQWGMGYEYGLVTQDLGLGFHFKRYELALAVKYFDGFYYNSNGLGVTVQQKLHF